MSVRRRKTEMDHRLVFATYLHKLKLYGPKAAMIKKQAFYIDVAEETGYTEESVKKIVLEQFKNNGKIS